MFASNDGDDEPSFTLSKKTNAVEEALATYYDELRQFEEEHRTASKVHRHKNYLQVVTPQTAYLKSERDKMTPTVLSDCESSECATSDHDSYFDDSDQSEDAYQQTSDVLYVYEKACAKRNILACSRFKAQIDYSDIRHRICLSNMSLISDDVIPMCIALTKMKTLTVLDLPGNIIEKEGLKFVIRLCESLVTLENVNLANNRLAEVDGARLLSEHVINNGHLKKLNISHNLFNHNDCCYIANIIKSGENLRSLNLSNNNFGSEGAALLAHAIGTNAMLESLNLSWNNIRLKGAIGVANAFKENGNIDHLDVSWNGFSDEGAAAFGAALRVNLALTHVNLAANRIGTQGAAELAKGMKVNESLVDLGLSMNPLTTKGVECLILAIEGNAESKISRLDVCSTNIVYNTVSILPTQPSSLHVRCNSFVRSHDFISLQKTMTNERSVTSDPEQILRMYTNQHKKPLLDLLKPHLETINEGAIEPLQMKRALKRTAIPLDDLQISKLVDCWERDENGLILLKDMDMETFLPAKDQYSSIVTHNVQSY